LKALQLEIALLECDWVDSVMPVETNIVVAILKDPTKRDLIISKLAEKDIKIMAFGPGMIRMVTHLDVSLNQIDEVCDSLKKI
jgi:threonine aldolase